MDPIDVSIEVLAEDVVTPQEESKGTETDAKVTGNRPIIAQIDKEELIIRFRDGMSPALIEAQDMNSVYVIMPVRV